MLYICLILESSTQALVQEVPLDRMGMGLVEHGHRRAFKAREKMGDMGLGLSDRCMLDHLLDNQMPSYAGVLARDGKGREDGGTSSPLWRGGGVRHAWWVGLREGHISNMYILGLKVPDYGGTSRQFGKGSWVRAVPKDNLTGQEVIWVTDRRSQCAQVWRQNWCLSFRDWQEWTAPPTGTSWNRGKGHVSESSI